MVLDGFFVQRGKMLGGVGECAVGGQVVGFDGSGGQDVLHVGGVLFL